MSNGFAKMNGERQAREVDLLGDFYAAWFKLHRRRHEKAERDELEQLAQELLEAHVSIETYRHRHERH